MAHQHYCICSLGQELLQPLDGTDVQVVCGLVEQQQVGFLQQQLRQLDAHAPSAGKLRRGAVKVAALESQTLQCPLQLGMIVRAAHHRETVILVRELLNQRHVGLALVICAACNLLVHLVQAFLHLADVGKSRLSLLHHGAAVGQHHHLWQIANRDVFLSRHLSIRRLLHSGNNLQHRALAGTIFAHQGDAVLGVHHKARIQKEWGGGKLHAQFIN